MKKYLLSLLIVPLLLIGGFSSAFKVDLQLNCNQSSCRSDKVYKYVYYVSDALPIGDYKIIDSSVPFSSYSYTVNYQYGGNDTGIGNPLTTTKKFNYLPPTANPYIEIIFNFDRNLGYGEKVDFSLVSSDYKPPLVNGGTANFTPVITGLTSSINEFIPYVVYVGLGVLGVLISFVAIKRLINWVRAKIFSSFK